MQIKSPAFMDGGKVPSKYTCEGANISPAFEFINVPVAARSLVLMVEDPDAAAKPWVHWLVFNIPPQCGGFPEGEIAQGATEGLCNGNTFGYEGPCPPINEHTYHFKLYALNTLLNLPPESDRKEVLKAMEGHIIAESILNGKYKKEKAVTEV